MSVVLPRHRCCVGDAQLHIVADVLHEHAQVEVDALDRGSRVEACRRTDVLLKVVWGKFPVSKTQALRRCSSKSATCEDSPASGKPTDRKSVVEGKSVSVRVDLGGGRSIKKKKKREMNRGKQNK